MTPRLPFFVYGTLRPGEPNHAAHLLGRGTTEEPAVLPGAALYAGPGYPYAVEDVESGPIRGELVTAAPSAHDPLLAALDLLEEYAPGDPRNLYERVVREVTRTADGTTAPAWVYVAAPRVAERLRASGTLIRGGDWSATATATSTEAHTAHTALAPPTQLPTRKADSAAQTPTHPI